MHELFDRNILYSHTNRSGTNVPNILNTFSYYQLKLSINNRDNLTYCRYIFTQFQINLFHKTVIS